MHGSLLVFLAEALATIKVWLPGGATHLVRWVGVVFGVDGDGCSFIGHFEMNGVILWFVVLFVFGLGLVMEV